MQTAIQAFDFDGAGVRTVMRDAEAWFVIADIAAALGYRDTNEAARILDDDEKGTQIVRTLGGKQKMLVCSESGLYALILRSRKQEARRFRKWVTGEVLPAIRKTGQYQADWRKLRHEAASSYKVMGAVLQMARADAGKTTASHHYSNEARLVNFVLLGKFEGVDRNALGASDLALLAHLEERNAVLIARDVAYDQRKPMLKQYAMDWRLTRAPQAALPA